MKKIILKKIKTNIILLFVVCYAFINYANNNVATKSNIYIPTKVSSKNLGEEVNDFELDGNFIIYKGEPYYTSKIKDINYINFSNYINKIFKSTNFEKFVYLPIPTKSVLIDDLEVIKKIDNQAVNIDNFISSLDSKILSTNISNVLKKYENEYIYYISDYRWTALASYYAYVEYCKLVDIEPYPLNHFKEKKICDNYRGSIYDNTHDEKTKNFIDVVYAYMPSKKCIMKNYYKNSFEQYDSCVVNYEKGYDSFIGGDSMLSIIDVLENDSNKTLIVFKDSYGNAMIPFLTEHYGKIFVVDPRYISTTYEKFINEVCEENVKINDCLFVTNFMTCNTEKWVNYIIKTFRDNLNEKFNSKDELFKSFYKDFYYYIVNVKKDEEYLRGADINSLDDFYKLNSTWDGGMKGMNKVGKVLGKYFLTMCDEDIDNIDNQKEKDGFIGYCLENEIYVDFIQFLVKYFYDFRSAEGVIRVRGENYGNFFNNSEDSVIDVAKLFYYNDDNLPLFLKNNPTLMADFHNIPLYK